MQTLDLAGAHVLTRDPAEAVVAFAHAPSTRWISVQQRSQRCLNKEAEGACSIFRFHNMPVQAWHVKQAQRTADKPNQLSVCFTCDLKTVGLPLSSSVGLNPSPPKAPKNPKKPSERQPATPHGAARPQKEAVEEERGAVVSDVQLLGKFWGGWR